MRKKKGGITNRKGGRRCWQEAICKSLNDTVLHLICILLTADSSLFYHFKFGAANQEQ